VSLRLGLRRAQAKDLPAPDMRTCNAPFVALRLSPDGNVNACGANGSHSLGNLGESSLRAIWQGSAYARFRSALAAADYSLGCQNCGESRAQGKRGLSHAEVYDRLTPVELGGWPRRIEFGLSNTCNLQCVQCNGDLSSAIRAQREHRPPLRSPYGDAFFGELREILPHLEVATFIGGEPFLTMEDRRVWDLLIELGARPEVHVTTNGTVWNDRVEYYLHALEMSVAVSIDAVRPETQSAIRVGSDLAQVRTNRDRFLRAVRSYGGSFTLNHCVMPQNWREFLPFLQEADELDVTVLNARVLRPHEFSLYSLPVHELRSVVEGMREQEASARLTRNRDVWATTLADLETHLERREASATPVGVRQRQATVTSTDIDLESIVTRLTGPNGLAPIHIVQTDEAVTSVTEPPWAATLGLASCIGERGEAIRAAIEQALGTPLDQGALADEEGVAWRRFSFERAGRANEFEVAVVGRRVEVAGRWVEQTHVLIGPFPI